MVRSSSQTIYDWKKYGLIHDDYKALYETYINTTHCNHCNREFNKTNYRCMDHDHATGLFRKIVCKACNVRDSYIKYPNGFDLKKYQQDYRDTNKEKMKEYNKLYKQENKEKLRQRNRDYDKKKFACGCGSVISNGNKSDHNKTLKHIDWWINSLD